MEEPGIRTLEIAKRRTTSYTDIIMNTVYNHPVGFLNMRLIAPFQALLTAEMHTGNIRVVLCEFVNWSSSVFLHLGMCNRCVS